MICQDCHGEIRVGDFPFCHGDPTKHAPGVSTAIGDECDIWQENGFHTPQHFTLKSERRRALAEKGLEDRVRHVTIPGTDKSPYTSDWSRGTVDLAAATALVSRPSQATTEETEPEMPMTHSIRELPTA